MGSPGILRGNKKLRFKTFQADLKLKSCQLIGMHYSQNKIEREFILEYSEGESAHEPLEEPRPAEQGEEGQEADHHGGCDGEESGQ